MATNRSRRSRRSATTGSNPRSYGNLRSRELRAATTAAGENTASEEPRLVRADAVDWSHDYNYIIKDLRQLMLVSALLFAGLLVVGYFL